MVRNYKRTSNRVSWSSESLKMALSDVKEGKMTIRAASIIYQIPRGTIQTGLKLQTDETTNLGRFKRVFSHEMELEQTQKAVQMETPFIGLSSNDFRRLAYLITVNGTTEPCVVCLFPAITCSCPTKGNCYHVMADKLATAMPGSTTKRPLNPTQLCKN